MIAVTIGCGRPWNFLAMKAADSCVRSTGLSTYVLGEHHAQKYGIRHPHHLKFHLFEEFPEADSILYFDADCLFLKPWKVPNDGFYAIEDNMHGSLLEESKSVGIGDTGYFNSGIMVLPKSASTALVTARHLSESVASIFRDQTYLNMAIREHGIPVNWLDRRFNRMHFKPGDDPEDAVVAHFMRIEELPAKEVVQSFLVL